MDAFVLAILSDSHDDVAQLRAALDLLRPHQPDYYIHCGDLCEPGLLDLFADLSGRFAFVFGNNDFDRAELRSRAVVLGLNCLGHLGELTLAGKRLAVLHGDDYSARRRLVESQRFDYLLHGHSHSASDQRVGKTRIINPGALHRARMKTVALLDLGTDGLSFLPLPTAV